MDAFAASWEVGARCRRLSWLLRASVVEAKHAQLARAFKAGFNPNDNLVRIPTLKHWQITGWYMVRRDAYGGVSPRTYLRGKDWAERTRVGHRALIENGVRKP